MTSSRVPSNPQGPLQRNLRKGSCVTPFGDGLLRFLFTRGALEAPLETGIEKAPQFGRGAKLRDGIELFDSRCECVGEAPDRSRFKLGIFWRVSANLLEKRGQL